MQSAWNAQTPQAEQAPQGAYAPQAQQAPQGVYAPQAQQAPQTPQGAWGAQAQQTSQAPQGAWGAQGTQSVPGAYANGAPQGAQAPQGMYAGAPQSAMPPRMTSYAAPPRTPKLPKWLQGITASLYRLASGYPVSMLAKLGGILAFVCVAWPMITNFIQVASLSTYGGSYLGSVLLARGVVWAGLAAIGVGCFIRNRTVIGIGALVAGGWGLVTNLIALPSYIRVGYGAAVLFQSAGSIIVDCALIAIGLFIFVKALAFQPPFPMVIPLVTAVGEVLNFVGILLMGNALNAFILLLLGVVMCVCTWAVVAYLCRDAGRTLPC